MNNSASYFIQEDHNRFTPTEHVAGGWNTSEQHIAPPVGLLAHLVEQNHKGRGGSLMMSSLHYDILGTLPLETVETEVKVLRPGRTIELVEASLSHGGRVALVLRAWLLKEFDTEEVAGHEFASIPGPEETPYWAVSEEWPGGFIRSLEARRDVSKPGRARTWARTNISLLDTEDVSEAAKLIGIIDLANGTAPRIDPRKMVFPNLDLALNLFREPKGEWVGYDTSVAFGKKGIGLTHTVMHDESGPFGTLAQTTTLRFI